MILTKAQKQMMNDVAIEKELPILAEWKRDLQTAFALEKKGLVRRVAEDRRMISIEFTEEGETYASKRE